MPRPNLSSDPTVDPVTYLPEEEVSQDPDDARDNQIREMMHRIEEDAALEELETERAREEQKRISTAVIARKQGAKVRRAAVRVQRTGVRQAGTLPAPCWCQLGEQIVAALAGFSARRSSQEEAIADAIVRMIAVLPNLPSNVARQHVAEAIATTLLQTATTPAGRGNSAAWRHTQSLVLSMVVSLIQARTQGSGAAPRTCRH